MLCTALLASFLRLVMIFFAVTDHKEREVSISWKHRQGPKRSRDVFPEELVGILITGQMLPVENPAPQGSLTVVADCRQDATPHSLPNPYEVLG